MKNDLKSIELVLGYFKKDKLPLITDEMVDEFTNKFIYDIHNKRAIKDFCESFKVEENIFWSVSCLLMKIKTCNRIRTKNFIETKINENQIKIFKRGITVKLIVNEYLPLFFTLKEKCLGSVSLNESKFWYSYIDSQTEKNLGINSFMERNEFVEQIISAIENNQIVAA